MSLPRFALDEEDDDATGPAQFVLKLPASYVRRLEQLDARPMVPITPSMPWTIETTSVAPAPSRWKLGLVLASVAVLVVIGAGVGGAAAAHGESPVGISKRAPKSLEAHVRAFARQTGVVTVSVEALHRPRPHVRRKH